MTLSAFAWNTYMPAPAGHGFQLGDVRWRRQLRGRHRHLPRHGRAGSLEHGAPGLPWAEHFGASWSP